MRAAVILVLASAVAAAVHAQAPASPSPAPSPTAEATDPDPDSAELSITGSISYRELKFDVAGTPKVEFSGRVTAPELGPDAQLHTVWHADRGSLPRPVAPGVIYRDNTVRFTITNRFEDLARLFAEDAAPATRAVPTPTAPAPSPSPEGDR